MGNIGIGELVVILLILLMVFGAKRLPEIGRSMGRTVSEFKKGMRDGAPGDAQDATHKDEQPAGRA